MGVKGFELGVQVHGSVDGVDEAVEPDAGVLVGVVGDHDDLVLGGQASDAKPACGGIERIGRDRHTVHRGRLKADRRHVEEGSRTFFSGAAAQARLAAEGFLAGQVEGDVVMKVIEEAGPFGRLGAQKIVLSHGQGRLLAPANGRF
jgi:hypothetical protein